jgi:hypothetical protein
MMTWQFGIKVIVTAVVVVVVSEMARRSSIWGAILASLPLTSLLAFIWLYVDTGDAQGLGNLSQSIFWLVLPSLPLFLLLPMLLRSGWSFWPSLAFACIVTISAYFGLVWLLERSGVRV